MSHSVQDKQNRVCVLVCDCCCSSDGSTLFWMSRIDIIEKWHVANYFIAKEWLYLSFGLINTKSFPRRIVSMTCSIVSTFIQNTIIESVFSCSSYLLVLLKNIQIKLAALISTKYLFHAIWSTIAQWGFASEKSRIWSHIQASSQWGKTEFYKLICQEHKSPLLQNI